MPAMSTFNTAAFTDKLDHAYENITTIKVNRLKWILSQALDLKKNLDPFTNHQNKK